MSSNTPSSDFFYKLPKSRQHIIALLVLFVVPFILFYATTLGGKELQRHDITQWRGAAESIIEYRAEFGEEPLWASNMFGGMPSFVISTLPQTVHLDYFSRFFRDIYPAFQYWVLLGGMYFFLTLMGFRSLTALFASLMYGLTSYFAVIIIAGHTSKFFALALIPWMFSGYWLIAKTKAKLWGLLIFTAAMALEVRAGHIQITYYFIYLLGFLWLYDGWLLLKEKSYKKFAIITGFLVLGGLMGAFGNAERMLSQQEYAKHSTRGGSAITNTDGLDSNYAFLWSQGISETLTIFMPNIYGGASPDYWGPKTSTSGPHYFGALSLLLLILALSRVREKQMYVFFGAGALGILFAWGENFAFFNQLAFDIIPLYNKFRAPETWLVLPAFAFSVVAAYALAWLLDRTDKTERSFKQVQSPVIITAVLFVGIFLHVNSFDFKKDGEVERIASQIAQQNRVNPQNPQVIQQANNFVNTRLVPGREEKAKSDLLRFGIILVIGGGVVYLLYTSRIATGLAGLILVTTIGGDMILVGQRYMPETSLVNSNVGAEETILSKKRDLDQFLIDNTDSGEGYPYRVLPLLDNAFSNSEPSYYYPSLGGYSAAKLSLAQDVFMVNENPLFSGSQGINLDLLRVLNTKYITYTPGLNLAGLTPVFQSNSGVVYEVSNVLPKAFFADSTVTANSPNEAYELIYSGRTDFSKMAIVEGFDAETYMDSTSTVEVLTYNYGAEMSFNLKRSEPGFLVISEIFYDDGWVALLNGEEVQIHKTNYLLRGIQIPAGEHTLELDFRPRSFYGGVMLSRISLGFQLGLLLLIGFLKFRKKPEEGEE
ncbi:MAG: hypothetical protein ED557_07710 [Balneola sp.]|nr:MAG: hypothetical protein ED557_07710 [Balneola sp.]